MYLVNARPTQSKRKKERNVIRTIGDGCANQNEKTRK